MKPCLDLPNGRLRPTEDDDLEDLVRLLHDAAVRRYLCDDRRLPRETVAAMLAQSAELDPQGLGLWAVEPEPDVFAGIAGLLPVSAEAGAAPEMAGGIEPIIALAPEFWGHGLAGVALKALIVHSGATLGLTHLVAAVDAPNARSHHLMTRCGFAATGRTPGPAHELRLYALDLAGDVAEK